MKLHQFIEARAREVFERYGYGEIRTPIFERTELFVRGVGRSTDIVSKEMYSFKDRAGRDLPPGGPGLEEETAITFTRIAADASRPVRNGWDRLRLAQALGAERRDEHVRRISEALARDRLRGLAPRSDRCRVLAIASGKGGVGKSNIAAGLAILLSAGGARVALVDADLGFGNLDVLLGVSPTLTLEDVFAGRKRLEEVLVEVAKGVRLAAGSPALAGMGLQGGFIFFFFF